jgi:hypothetical protein
MTRVTSEGRPSRRQCGGKYVDVQRFEHQVAMSALMGPTMTEVVGPTLVALTIE